MRGNRGPRGIQVIGILLFVAAVFTGCQLLDDLRRPFAKGLPRLVQGLLLPNIIPEFGSRVLLEEAAGWVPAPNFVDNHARKFALLWLGTGDVGNLVLPHESPKVLIPRVVVHKVTSTGQDVMVVRVDNVGFERHGCVLVLDSRTDWSNGLSFGTRRRRCRCAA